MAQNESLQSIRQHVTASEEEPVSERRPRHSLSTMLWGIDWSAELPVDAGNGVTVVSSSYDECLPFVREHYAAIFEEDGTSPFTMTREGPLKERYYRLAGDFFAFKDGERTVGLLVGTAADWSSYYIRSAAVLPSYAGKQIVHGFLPWLFDALKRAGIERVEADTSPANFAVLGILTKFAFNVTGTSLTDRWGAHVHLTKHLADDREDVFLRQYCSGVRYQLRGRSMTNDPMPPERSSP